MRRYNNSQRTRSTDKFVQLHPTGTACFREAPLRAIRKMVGVALVGMDRLFRDLHSTFGTTIDEPAIAVDGRSVQPVQNKATIA